METDFENETFAPVQIEGVKITKNSRGYNFDLKMNTLDVVVIEVKLREIENMLAKFGSVQ